jgi:REP element-mobilizing transposase RayT
MAAHQQLLCHIVFSVKDRRPLLQDDELREATWAYMAGIAKNLYGFALKIGGFYDHAHLLVRIPAKIAVADFVGRLKANTSKHINESRDAVLKFHWQDGYGAFTVSPSQSDSVIAYIENQNEHHRRQTFQDEFLILLERHGIEYDPKYL